MFKTIKSRIGLTVALAAVMAMSVCSSAFAVAQDYSDVTGDISTELTAALPVALAGVSLIIGVTLAYKTIRKILRA